MTDACLFSRAAECLAECDPMQKTIATRRLAADWRAGRVAFDVADFTKANWVPIAAPGRPRRPELVAPKHLAARGLQHASGRAALIHAVAHIELNAVNLAWDAVQRFAGLPREFYADWISVADEEAYHFGLMRERLQALDYDYGDFPAHDGLWSMARQTASDPLERMALVPRVMEARGLDVTPGMIERFKSAGDAETAQRLDIILRDEIGHVAIGSRWFRYLCEVRGVEPEETYVALIERHLRGRVRCPLNRAARLEAGFDERELDRLEAMCRRGR
ncbi:MAG: ferritin-like domain-containing protein [Thiohalocapsa sp.]|nr:ferritin-like domain-containing protein [Thiohalocapsa sp.]